MIVASIITILLALLLGYQALGVYNVVDLINLTDSTNPYITTIHVCVLKWSPVLAFMLLGMGVIGVWFLHKDHDQYKLIMSSLLVAVFAAIFSIL